MLAKMKYTEASMLAKMKYTEPSMLAKMKYTEASMLAKMKYTEASMLAKIMIAGSNCNEPKCNGGKRMLHCYSPSEVAIRYCFQEGLICIRYGAAVCIHMPCLICLYCVGINTLYMYSIVPSFNVRATVLLTVLL